MEWTRRIGIAVLALLLVANAVAPGAWAEEALPESAAAAKPEGAASAKEEQNGGREAAAAATNVLYVPGKAVACVLSGAFWVGAMALSLGGAYNDPNVSQIITEGCGGKWVLKGEDMPSAR